MSGTGIAKSIVRKIRSWRAVRTVRMAWQRIVGDKFETPEKLSMVVVEVTTYCNLKCAGCVRTIMDERNTWHNVHMQVENFRRIVDSLPPAELFIPQGIGESTMHPNIVELMRVATQAKKFDRIEINTNGLVRSVDFYGELFDAGLSSLTVSVDTLDVGLIERVRSGTDVAKLEMRLREFAERFPDRMGIRVTVSKWNMGQLAELLQRLDRLGRFNVFLQPFFDMGNSDGVLSADEAQHLESTMAEQSGEYLNLTIHVEPFFRSKDICRAPWRSPAITVDGYLKPCCMVLHQEALHFGDVLAVPFSELWHSPAVREFRSQFIQRSPSCCAQCPYYSMRA